VPPMHPKPLACLQTALCPAALPAQYLHLCPLHPQDVMAYLRLAVSLHNDVALSRIINTPRRGLGDTSIDKLQAAAKAQGTTLCGLLFGGAAAGGGGAGLPQLPDRKELGLTAKAAAALEAFRELVLELHRAVASQPLARAMQAIIDKVRLLGFSWLASLAGVLARLASAWQPASNGIGQEQRHAHLPCPRCTPSLHPFHNHCTD